MSIFYWSNLNVGESWTADISGLANLPPMLSDAHLFFSDILSVGIFIDEANKKFYWADAGLNTIFVANISDPTVPTVPTNPIILFSDGNLSTPAGLFVDTVNSKLYWTNTGDSKIWVGAISDLANPAEPSDQYPLLSDNVNFPGGVCLDIDHSKIYWSNSLAGEIWVGDISDSPANPTTVINPVLLLLVPSQFINSLFFDPINSKLYWTNAGASNEIFVGDISDRDNPTPGVFVYDLLTSDNLNTPAGIFITGISSDVSSDDACVLTISNLDGDPVVCADSFFDIFFDITGASDARCTLTFDNSDYVSDFAAGSHSFNVQAPSVANDYTVTLSAFNLLNSDCSDVSAISITVDAPVTSLNLIASSDTVCLGASVTLTASGDANHYVWFDDSIDNPYTFIPTQTSDYRVTGYSLNEVCFSDAFIQIIVSDCSASDLPCVLVISDLHGGPICVDSFFDIFFNINGVSDARCALNFNGFDYVSDVTAGSHSFNIQAPSVASDHVATLSAHNLLNSDCSDVKQTMITVDAPVSGLTITVIPSDAVCSGTTVTLTASGADHYLWSNGSSDNPLIFIPPQTSDYAVTGFSQNGACNSDTAIHITVKPPATVDAGSDQTVCAGTLVTLGVGSAELGVAYEWSPLNGIISPNHFPTAALICSDITYTVVASRLDISDCFSSDSVTFTSSDCNCDCQQAQTTFSQPCKNCPSVTVSIQHKDGSDSTIAEFFSSDGHEINIKDNCFISSYTPIKKNIGINKSYGSDLGFGYVCYTYSNGLTVVRQENGDIILVNNGDINIDSPIDLTNAFHFGDWIGPSDLVSSDKKQPDLILMSNKGSININQNVTVPGLVTCMAPNGHVQVVSGKTLQSTKDRVVIMASDANHGSGTITGAITDNSGGTPSGNILTISDLTDSSSASDTIRILTSDHVVITNNAVLTKNLEIITPGSVTTFNITCFGKNISITAGHITASDLNTSNTSNSDNADGGNITLISQNEIICRNLSANGGSEGGAGGGAGGSSANGGDGGDGGNDGDGGTITLIAGTSISTTSLSANGSNADGGAGGGAGGSSANGGDGGDGGNDGDGGTITLIAGTSISTASLSANGSNADGGAGTAGTDGDGGTITLIACGNITVTSASADPGSGSGSVAGKILIKSYGAITGALTSTPNVQIIRMRDLRITLDANPKILPAHSDMTLTITIFNNGLGLEPSDNIVIDATAINGVSAPLPLPPLVSFPTLLPGQSDQFIILLSDVHAGKFQYSVDVPGRCVHAQTATVGIVGSDSALKVTLDLSDSHLLFDLFLPSDFIAEFGVPSTHQELCSDLHAYVQGSSKQGAFTPQIVEDFGPENSRIKEKAARPAREKEKSPISYEKGSVIIKREGADGFELIISDCTSDTIFIQYRDDLVPLFTKEMKVIGYEALVVTIVQEATSLGIVSVLPSDQSIKFSDMASFNIVVQNTGPVDVSDAFIKITSNLNETFSDKLIGFLPSDGTLVSDTITITPLVAGNHVFSFEIDSTIVINTNTTTNIFSDVFLDVCQLDIAMTTVGPIIALPNLPFVVPFDLTKTGGNSTAHITAKISDVAYYQSDFSTGSHTIIIDAPGAFVDNTIVKLEASDGACFDADFHVIQVIDSLSDAASLLGTTVSDIKNAIDSNEIIQTIPDFLGRSDLIPPGLPADIIDRLWDTPVFQEVLPLLLDRPGGLFDTGSLIHLLLFGSLIDMTITPNPTLMLYLVLNLIPLPTSDTAVILQTICQAFSAHSDMPHTATIHVNDTSDFLTPGALILTGSPSVNLSCSDNNFFFVASDGSFQLSMTPFNSNPYLLCYSDNTQQICKTFSDKTSSFNVVLVSDNTIPPLPFQSRSGLFNLQYAGSLLDFTLALPPELSMQLPVTSDVQLIFSDICIYADLIDCQKFLAGLVINDSSDLFCSDAVILQSPAVVVITCSDNVLNLDDLDHRFTFSITNFMSDSVFIQYSDASCQVSDTMSLVDGNFAFANSDVNFLWIDPCLSDSLNVYTNIFSHPLLIIDAEGDITDVNLIDCVCPCHNPTNDLLYTSSMKNTAIKFGNYLEAHYSDYPRLVSDQCHLLYQGSIIAGVARLDFNTRTILFHNLYIPLSDVDVCD